MICNSGSIVDSLELALNENMHNHVLSKFDDLTSLRGTQKDLIVYEKSMTEHNLVVFTMLIC